MFLARACINSPKIFLKEEIYKNLRLFQYLSNFYRQVVFMTSIWEKSFLVGIKLFSDLLHVGSFLIISFLNCDLDSVWPSTFPPYIIFPKAYYCCHFFSWSPSGLSLFLNGINKNVMEAVLQLRF